MDNNKDYDNNIAEYGRVAREIMSILKKKMKKEVKKK